jgi:hypothetical protein
VSQVMVLAPFFDRRQAEPISTSPYAASPASHTCRIMAPGPVISDVSKLPFFDFVRQLDSTQCYFRIPEYLEPKHRITPLRRLPVIMLNRVIQVLAGPDERLSGQDAFGLQFGYGLMRLPAAVECDLLRGLVITDRFFEEAYGCRFVSILTQVVFHI